MANESHIANLIARQLRRDITATEEQELGSWRDAYPSHRTFMENEAREEVLIGTLREGRQVSKDAAWRKFEILRDQYLLSQQRAPIIRRYRQMAAAVLIALAGIGLYLWRSSSKEAITETPSPLLAGLPVSAGKASLSLEDGTSIGIDPAAKGWVAIQGATIAAMGDSNRVRYTTDVLNMPGFLFRTASPAPAISYNVLHVPYGSKYELTLPDGVHVILNAGSTLRYPITGAGHQRNVELTGQAYFSVPHDPQHPFIVGTSGKEIEVLGTEFSVRNYPGEQLQTVILQKGKVKVHSGKQIVELHPGQEAQVRDNDAVKVINVNLDKALSWKEGYFNFDDLDLRAAVCQLAQWHGMKVRIEKDVKAKSLGIGNIAQGIPLPKLLKLLELPDLHFEIRDSTIIVRK
jgi:ferric-dicitrate binding protein FerR (iron transport regulator)